MGDPPDGKSSRELNPPKLGSIHDASDEDSQLDDDATELLFKRKGGRTSYHAAVTILRKVEGRPTTIYGRSLFPIRQKPPIGLG